MASVKAVFVFYLVAAHRLMITLAMPLEERGDSVCGSGIYGELAPILEQYAIAEVFCSTVYPVSCTTPTSAKHKRGTPMTTATSKITTTSKVTTTMSASKAATSLHTMSTADAKASAWSKCQRQPGNVISTMCSCIETPAVGSFI